MEVGQEVRSGLHRGDWSIRFTGRTLQVDQERQGRSIYDNEH